MIPVDPFPAAVNVVQGQSNTSAPLDRLRFGNLLASARSYRKGAVLWARGQLVDDIYMLRRGQVSIQVTSRSGRSTTVRTVRPGELFGLLTLCTAHKRSAQTTATADVRSEVLQISLDNFVSFLHSDTAAAFTILADLAEQLVSTQQRLCVLAEERAEDRVTTLLEQLCSLGGAPSTRGPGWVQIHFTHEELAHHCGLTRPHLSVVMGRLRKQGVVCYQRGTPLHVNAVWLQHRASELA